MTIHFRLLTATLLMTASAASAQEYRQAQAKAAEAAYKEYTARQDDYAKQAAEGYRAKCLNYADASYCDKLVAQQEGSGDVQASAQPAAQSATQITQYAAAANQKISDGLPKGALPATAAIVSGVNAATQKISTIDQRLSAISAKINGPRPDYFGVADEVMDLMNQAGDAVYKAVPDGHELAEDYYPLVARVGEYDAYGDAIKADKAMDVAIANLQRALVETRKDAYRIGERLMSMGDRELGYRDLRAFSYDSNMTSYQDGWNRAETGLAAPADAPAAYAGYMKQLSDMSVSSWQASNQ